MKNTTGKYCSVAFTGMVILYDFTHTVYTKKPPNTTWKLNCWMAILFTNYWSIGNTSLELSQRDQTLNYGLTSLDVLKILRAEHVFVCFCILLQSTVLIKTLLLRQKCKRFLFWLHSQSGKLSYTEFLNFPRKQLSHGEVIEQYFFCGDVYCDYNESLHCGVLMQSIRNFQKHKRNLSVPIPQYLKY